MATVYEANDGQIMDEQSGTAPGDTNTKNSSSATFRKTPLTSQVGGDDTDVPSIGGTLRPSAVRTDEANLDEASEFASEESAGESPITVGGIEGVEEVAELNEEIGNPEGQEAGEEYYEATPEQLEASGEEAGEEAGEEGLFDVIKNVVGGFLGGEAGEISEAGEAIEGSQEAEAQEEFAFLAALIPTLVSSIGPVVAKQVVKKLSPLARQGIKRLAKLAVPPQGRKPARNALGTFAKLLETAQDRPGGESGAEVGEELNSLINEAVATIEVIIGTDDRKQVQNTTGEPWRRICALRITFPSGQTYRGTGFFIGPRAVATAGHCVYMHGQGGWARKVEVIPGANGASQPNGSAVSSTFRSVRGWVTNKKPENDYGCIVLAAGAFNGRNLGKFGFGAFDSKALLAKTAVLSGYPGDKPFAEMWGMKRRIKTVTAKTLVYDIDTMGGQSGAPVYMKRNGKRYVVGIHNYGNSKGNSATRVTAPVFNNLKKWSKI